MNDNFSVSDQHKGSVISDQYESRESNKFRASISES